SLSSRLVASHWLIQLPRIASLFLFLKPLPPFSSAGSVPSKSSPVKPQFPNLPPLRILLPFLPRPDPGYEISQKNIQNQRNSRLSSRRSQSTLLEERD
ncbi:hypothetical protein Csa_023976, partial [Cucumis sativus]